MAGEVNDIDVAIAKDAQRSPGQVLHLCGKKREKISTVKQKMF